MTIIDKATSTHTHEWTSLKLCGARHEPESRPTGRRAQLVEGPGQDMAYVLLHKHPRAKRGAGLLRGPGESYQVFMGTSMEPPVKLLVPGMNNGCLPGWTFSCQKKWSKTKGEQEEASKTGKGADAGDGRRPRGRGQEPQQSSSQVILLINSVILF